jgi:ATP-dependent exoDNAse (exonuclease V) alpha subunit
MAMSRAQREAVDDIFLSREKILGLDGVAGAGKTTTLTVIQEGAEAQGYRVEGFAPTSRAAHKLAEAGMQTSTLQHHLAKGVQPDTREKRLYVLDESSLASTRQMHEFMQRLHRNDRVLLVGDSRHLSLPREGEGVLCGGSYSVHCAKSGVEDCES